MQNTTIRKITATVTGFLVMLTCISVHASMLDTPSPYWSQNHPLGRNPARAPYLKKKSRINASYTLGTQLIFTDNFITSIEHEFPYFKELEVSVPEPYTNAYFSYAMPLPVIAPDLYIGLVYNNLNYSKKIEQVPSGNTTIFAGDTIEYYEEAALSESQAGLTIAFPLFNKKLYAGIEALQGVDRYNSISYENITIASLGANDHNINLTSRITDPYYVYTLGFLFPLNPLVLSLTQTVTTPKFVRYENRYKHTPDPQYDFTEDEEYYDYYPPVTGLGVLCDIGPLLNIGLSSEFYGQGSFFDRSSSEQNYMITKPFTRYALGIEYRPVRSFTIRTFGSVTPEKDARTNYYDRSLLIDKLSHTFADEDSTWLSYGTNDGRYVFNEEEFGLDLEFTFNEIFSTVLGASKKNYIFPGTRPPYGIALAVEDVRTYFGLSFIGVFEGDGQPQQKAKPAPTTYDKIPTADKKLPDRDTENAITPKEGTPNAYTTFKEEVYVSAQNVFPGDNVIVTIKEGKNPLFKATVGYTVKKQEYRYPLYQDDAEHTWKATVPVSPLTPPGSYTLKLNKIYDDTSLEVSTFPITVKALPKDQQ